MSVFNSMMQYFASFQPGFREVDGGDCLTLAKLFCAPQTGFVALAGGNAASGTQLPMGPSRVDTVASGADSVRLPPAIPGAICIVYNGGAQSMQVFGQQANQGGLDAGDQVTVNNSVTAAAVATGVAQASSVMAIYYCFVVGVWKQMISA